MANRLIDGDNSSTLTHRSYISKSDRPYAHSPGAVADLPPPHSDQRASMHRSTQFPGDRHISPPVYIEYAYASVAGYHVQAPPVAAQLKLITAYDPI